MKYKIFFLILVIFLFINIAHGENNKFLKPGNQVLVELFFQSKCPTCRLIEETIFPHLTEQYPEKLKISKINIDSNNNLLKLIDIFEKLKTSSNNSVNVIVNRKFVLSGREVLSGKLSNIIKNEIASGNYFDNSIKKKIDTNRQLKKKYETFSTSLIMISGLLDGINPCAISTLVFFISLLSVMRVNREKVLISGGIFCFAIFMTYVLLGFGIFRVIQLFSFFEVFRIIFHWGMIIFLLFAGIFSLRDAWVFNKSQKNSDIFMKLPNKLRRLINHTIKSKMSSSSLYFGSLLTGICITLIESVCTGQIYVPVLFYLFKSGDWTLKTVYYLILYNFMFIMPLLVVFIFTGFGLKHEAVIKWVRNNMIKTKISFAILFFVLAGLLVCLK